jgi:hypothetical protein
MFFFTIAAQLQYVGLSLCYILSSLFAKRLWTEILEESHLFLNSPRISCASLTVCVLVHVLKIIYL